jgi:hypothetical protein
MATESKSRIVIALTESSPVPELWRAAMRVIQQAPAEIVTLYFEDDKWRRAASLSFTREISRTGRVTDFSLRRAEEVHRDAIARVRRIVARLAEEAEVSSEFEVLPEADVSLVRRFLGRRNVLVAPSHFSQRPLYVELTKLDCRILLVEAREENESREADQGLFTLPET